MSASRPSGNHRSSGGSNPHTRIFLPPGPMSTSFCRFCRHPNLAGAKFCNDCGSPLHLKPCPKCEAVNEVLADHCYQCGTPLDEEPATKEVGETLPSTAAAPATIASVSQEEHAHIPESLAQHLGAHDRMDRADEVLEPIGHQRAARPRRSRRAFYAASFVLASVGIGVAAYYAYLSQMPFDGSERDGALVGKFATPEQKPAGTPSIIDRTMPAPPMHDDSRASGDASSSAAPSSAGAPAGDARASSSAALRPETSVTVSADHSRAETRPATGRERTMPKPKPAPAESNRPARSMDAAAVATRRLVARDMAGFVPMQEPAAQAPADRDAIETQRLIQRDLGAFLTPLRDGRTQRTAPMEQ
jgi:hypothetical protein